MAASTPRFRARIPYNLSVIALVLINLGVGAEILIIANYFSINQAVQTTTRSTSLLPQLSELRAEVLRLDTQTQAALTVSLPDLQALEAQRAAVVERLNALRVMAFGLEQFVPAYEAVDLMLITFDSQLNILRGAPSRAQLAVVTFELQRTFRRTEAVLDEVYAAEERRFFGATGAALSTLRNSQIILLGASGVILVLGAVMAVILRRTAQSEIARAYDRLQVAAEVGRAASSILDQDELFQTTLNLIRDRFGYYHASIFLLDEPGEYAVLRESTGEVGRQLKERGHRLAVGSPSIIGHVTAERAARVASDVSADPVHFKNELLPDTRSELAVPLVLGDRLLGALDVQSQEPDAFSEADVQVLQTLADQIAVALGTAVEYGREQARVQRMATLSEAALELTGPQLSQAALLDRIVRGVIRVIGADEASVWLAKGPEEIERKVTVSSRPGGQLAEVHESRRFKKGTGPLGQVFATGQPLRAEDAPTHANLSVPMVWQGRVVGVLALTRSRPGRVFTAEEERLAQLFATQAASALENARLIAESQRHAAQLAVSAEVARVAASLHDLPELLRTTARLISERFGFYHAGIFLLDDARQWAVLRAANSPGGQRMLARGHRLRVGQAGLVGHATGAGQPRVAQDVGGDTVHLFNPDLPETRSEAAVPLLAHGEVIGALDVQSVEANAFSDDDVKVLLTLADQLGVAIENARLFEATQRSIEELRALQREARQAFRRGEPEAQEAYLYDGVEVRPLAAARPPEAERAAEVLQVPIQMGDEDLGLLELKRAGEDWTQEDLTLAEAIANRMALALENARLFDATRAALAETARLYNASRAIAAARSLDEILRAIIAYALEPHHARFVIGLTELGPDKRPSALQVAAAWDTSAGAQFGAGPRYSADDLPLLQRLTPEAPTLVPALDAPDVDATSRAVFAAQGLRSLAAVPLVAGGALLGVFLVGTREPHTFVAEELRLLQALADQAATAIENLRLLEETRQRIAELATINSLSQALTSQLELRALIKLVGDKIVETFGVRNGYIALYDSQTNLIEVPYFVEGEREVSLAPVPLGRGLASIIIQSRQPLLINEDAARRTVELGAIIAGKPAQSYLGVPIIVGDRVIGVISVQSLEQPGLFREADVRLLTTLAANVGVAIQNARLFEQTRRRVAELAAINSIGQALASQADVRNLLHIVGEKILQTFEVAHGFIALYDEQTQLIEMAFLAEGDQRPAVTPFPRGQGLTTVILDSRQPLLINEDAERRITELGARVVGQVPKSFLGVPIMVVGDEAIGVISVQSLAQEKAFTEADVRLLTTIAANVGVAIQNARLFDETRQRAQQLATAADVSRAAASLLDPDELIHQTVELIRNRFDLYYAAIFLVNETGQWAVLQRATGEAGRVLREQGHRLEVGGNSMVGAAIARRQARVALDVGAEPVRFANPLLPDTRSEMALPLVVGDTVLGALDVQSTRPNAFTEADVTALQTMADQVAIAIRNAQLLSEMQRNQNFLDSIFENLPSMLFVKDARDLRIVRWNKAGEELLGIPREEMIGKTDYDLRPREEADLLVFNEREVLESRTLYDIPEEPVQTRPRGLRYLHTQKIPILDEHGQPQYLLSMSEDITERKQAEAEIVKRNQQLAAANEIGRAASSTLDLDTLLRTSVELLRERFGLYHASIYIVEPGSKMAVLRESTGEAGQHLKRLKHQLAVGSRSLVGAATATQSPVIVQDVAGEPLHLKNPLLPETRAQAVFPLVAGHHVVGALDVQSTTVGAFDESDIAILATIADQLAVAIQNARLFDRVARQARREKLVGEITGRVRAAGDVEGMLRTAVTELRKALGVRHGAVRLSLGADGGGPRPGEAGPPEAGGKGNGAGTPAAAPDIDQAG